MKLKKLDPLSPEAIDATVEMVRNMTPEEALAFLKYRTPGVEETDMTGMLNNGHTEISPNTKKLRARA
jgi:hypothetical protein